MMRQCWSRRVGAYAVCTVMAGVSVGCSLQRLTVEQTAQVLRRASVVMEREPDVQLAREVFPGMLKTTEGLLESHPEQSDLLALLAEGYSSYAFGFLEEDMLRLEASDIDASFAIKTRVLRFYDRARSYGLRLLAKTQPALAAALEQGTSVDPLVYEGLDSADVPGMYWACLPWLLALRVDKSLPQLLAGLPIVRVLMTRVTELQPDFDAGGAWAALGGLEAGVPQALGGDSQASKRFFDRAVEITDSGYLWHRVLLGQGVGVQSGNKRFFLDTLIGVTEADPDQVQDWALRNRLAQRRARLYIDRVDDIFPGDAP